MILKTDDPVNELERCNLSNSRFIKTSVRKKGTATWSKKGEWIKESSSEALRLILSENPQTFIAMQDERNKSFLQRIRDHFTHITVYSKRDDGKKETISLNLGSLSKRTQKSFATILLLRITGKLTLDYIEESVRKAQENTQLFDRIIQNGLAKAIERGEDPNEKVNELKEVLHTVMKSRLLARGIFAKRGETTYIAYKNINNRFTIGEKRGILGEGSYGIVYEILNLETGDLDAAKFAKKTDKKNGLKNEDTILKLIHKDGHVNGVQCAPHFFLDLKNPDCGAFYIIKKFGFNLDNLDFLKSPMLEKLQNVKSLFNGLNEIHKKQIIHGDIKTANCCSENGEFQLADFGHARKSEHVLPEQPLKAYTPYFTSETDQQENMRLTLTYFLHQMAIGNIHKPYPKILILKAAIEHPSLIIDREAAKLTVASLLMKLKQEDFKIVKLPIELFKTEIEFLKQNPKNLAQLDMKNFKLNKYQLDQLTEQSLTLCKGHDVYGLGITLLCILTGNRFIAPKSIQAAFSKMTKNPDLTKFNPDLTKLLRDMMCKDSTKRPTSNEAMNRYYKILDKAKVGG